jgi:seryl-tRNA synthetase
MHWPYVAWTGGPERPIRTGKSNPNREGIEPVFDIKWIRDNAAAFDAGLANRGLEAQSAALIKIDEERRANLGRLQEAQARRNAASKDIGKAKASKDEAAASKLMAEVAELKDVIAKGERRSAVSTRRSRKLAVIPNLLRDDADRREGQQGSSPRRHAEDVRLCTEADFEFGEGWVMDFETAGWISARVSCC